MHSNRMRTTHSSTITGEGLCDRDPPWTETPLERDPLDRHPSWTETHPPVDRMTDTYENITLSQTSFENKLLDLLL